MTMTVAVGAGAAIIGGMMTTGVGAAGAGVTIIGSIATTIDGTSHEIAMTGAIVGRGAGGKKSAQRVATHNAVPGGAATPGTSISSVQQRHNLVSSTTHFRH